MNLWPMIARPHFAHNTIALLRHKFPGRVISRIDDVTWPPKPSDLTPLDWSFRELGENQNEFMKLSGSRVR